MVAVRDPKHANRHYHSAARACALSPDAAPANTSPPRASCASSPRARSAASSSCAAPSCAAPGSSWSGWAQMAAVAARDSNPGPAPELLVAWNIVSTGLVPPAALGLASSRTSGAVPPKEEELRAAVEVLRGHGLHSVLEEWFLEVLQSDLQANISLEFWNAVSQRENCADEPQCLLLLLDAFGLLESRLDPYLHSLELLEKWTRLGLLMGTGAQGLREKVHTTLRGVLFFSTPRAFQEMVQRLYGRFLRVYMQSKRKGEGGTDPELEGELDSRYARRRYYRLLQSPLCAGCGSDKQQCWCRQALEQFHQLSQVLLSLLERVSAEAVTTTLHQVTRERMEDRCRGEYERSFLREFHKWIERVVGWLGRVFLQDGPARPSSPVAGDTLRRWRCHIQRFFYRIYAGLRIEELFSVIRDFPDSRPAVEDLKYCLQRTDQRQQLLVSLKAALETRLLHPGVNTCDIITLYISAIKALRVLDPSMVILEVACEPIRRYLRTREDTVRQIVAGLTGDSDGTGDLAVELSKTDPASLETGQDSEDDSGEPEDWVPDPVDADPGKSSSKRRSSDIISLLVSIYGSKDLFINEYRSLLADRLLHQFSFSPEREIRNVELLKLRFGEAPMHFCEVMLKDMADSRRINANIREEDEKRPAEEQPPFGVYAVILSSEFWPPFKDEKLEVPEDIREALEAYCRKYEKLKAMRTLSWKHTLGLVTMDVELADRTLSVAVTPVQAVVLLYFQDQASWTLEELSKVVKMPVALLRRRMSVWLQQGVLREEPAGTFSVVEEERPQDRDNMVLIDSDDESDSGMASQADQKEEELLLFWTYIQAMLTNLESLSLERIYSMLRMFVVTGPALAEIDLQELQGFLQRKVRDQQLIYAAGVYRLPKSCS
ncbi:anaphase-promoting complex subunit 2 isoform X2 [Manis pentadactyla]|uniref:anaphase-promoting complex subunit 2 isoform X2 n=1 Tax=Manis pentadactyla TaxID=143292 RepID=UPI00255C7540|nr:anaphase-promoting complex subunit 2 isoform X2 [Manis pentadactyla]